jgi:hypothetical protein
VSPNRARQVSPVLTWDRRCSSPIVNGNKQDETFVVFSVPFVTGTDLICAGDKLQMDIQHWLSPPNPSTNHNSASEARYGGTAAWFFKSEALKEWRARGSLLWIHGKRMFYESLMSALCIYNFVDFEAGAGKSTLLYVMSSFVCSEFFKSLPDPRSLTTLKASTQSDWPTSRTITLIFGISRSKIAMAYSLPSSCSFLSNRTPAPRSYPSYIWTMALY